MMASACLGLFGDFKYSKEDTSRSDNPEVVWVSKRYNPTDERSSVPVGRFKTIKTAPPCDNLPPQWIPVQDPSLKDISRSKEENLPFSQRSTRCEEWSTLREILPSKGIASQTQPPKWGSGQGPPPAMNLLPPKRHPKINSSMTKYMDEMHLTHKEFKMF